MSKWLLKNEQELEDVVKEWVKGLRAGTWIALQGDLGVGKTTFVRKVLKSLGYEEPVASPTFPILIEYELEDLDVVHIDAYRLQNRDLESFDLEDWKSKLLFMEWPENFFSDLKNFPIKIRLSFGDQPGERILEIENDLFEGGS